MMKVNDEWKLGIDRSPFNVFFTSNLDLVHLYLKNDFVFLLVAH